MIKNLESLGTVLSREEQKQVNGGLFCITLAGTTICYHTPPDGTQPITCIPDGLPGTGGPGVGCPAGTSCSSTGQCV